MSGDSENTVEKSIAGSRAGDTAGEPTEAGGAETATPDSSEPNATVPAQQRSGLGRYLRAWTAAPVGVLVTGALAVADVFWPALTVLAGAVTASGLLVARSGGTKRYLLTGVAYCLGLALVIEFGGTAVSPTYTRGVLPAVGGFGALGGLVVVAKVAGKRVVKHLAVIAAYDEAFWEDVWEALASVASLLSLIWVLVTFTEKVVRYASASVGAVALLVANMLGYELIVTVLGVELEAVMVLFVGCVLVWFHLLETLHNSWRAVARSAEKAQERRPDGETDAPAGGGH